MSKALTIVAETLREELPLYGAGWRASLTLRTLTARTAYKNRGVEQPRCLDKEA